MSTTIFSATMNRNSREAAITAAYQEIQRRAWQQVVKQVIDAIYSDPTTQSIWHQIYDLPHVGTPDNLSAEDRQKFDWIVTYTTSAVTPELSGTGQRLAGDVIRVIAALFLKF